MSSSSYGGPPADDEQDQIDRIMAWAEYHTNFDTSFVESLQEQLSERGSLSESQIAALDNILAKWGIE